VSAAHGVGVSVVNALSEALDLEIWRNGQVYTQSYERGIPAAGLEITGTTKRRGTKVTFRPDPQIFETTVFSFDTLAQRLRELAFLNGGIVITLDDERDGKNHKFHYDGGIVSFVTHLNKNKSAVNEKPIYMRGEKDGIEAEIALQWNDGYAEMVYSSRTTSIRTRAAPVRVPIGADACDQLMRDQNNLAKDLGSVPATTSRRLTGVISVKIPHPQFKDRRNQAATPRSRGSSRPSSTTSLTYLEEPDRPGRSWARRSMRAGTVRLARRDRSAGKARSTARAGKLWTARADRPQRLYRRGGRQRSAGGRDRASRPSCRLRARF
jgi:DNA gyrase subunit B